MYLLLSIWLGILLVLIGLIIGGIWLFRYRANYQRQLADLNFSVSRYRSLYEHYEGVIVELNLSGKIMALNPTAQQLRKISMDMIQRGSFVSLIAEEDREGARQAFQKAASGELSKTQLSTIQIAGNSSDWDVTFLPIRVGEKVSGVYGVGINCTDQRRLERELVQRDNSYRLIAENMTDIVLVTDTQGVPSYVSPSFTKVLGLELSEQVYQQPVDAYFDDHMAGIIQEKFRQLLLGVRSVPSSFLFKRSDGGQVWLESLSAPVLSRDGQIEQIIIVVRNITKRIEAERTLQQNEDLYIKMQASLDEFSRDASGMINTLELKRKLVDELEEVLGIHKISILETSDFKEFTYLNDYKPAPEELAQMAVYENTRLPLGHLQVIDSGAFFLIGEFRGKYQIVRLGEPSPMLNKRSVQSWIMTISRYANVFMDNRLKIQDLTTELEIAIRGKQSPSWLLRFVYNLSEKERRLLAQDLHDSALQEQIVWYRELEMLTHSPDLPEELQSKLGRIGEGLLDVIHQIRVTCNDLRPPFLKEWGIIQALEALYDQMQIRSDFAVEFDYKGFHCVLSDEQLIALYRINQELLANAFKHSQASLVRILLSDDQEGVRMTYTDNGIGLPPGKIQRSSRTMGLFGIQERVRSLEGEIHIRSVPGEGLQIEIYLPRYYADESLFMNDITEAGDLDVEHIIGR